MIAASIALGLSFAAGTARGEAPKPDVLTSEPARGTYVRVHDATLLDPVGPQQGGSPPPPPHLLFLQRCAGGLELMPGGDDSIGNTSSILVGPASLPEYPYGPESWQQVVVESRSIFAPFNIEITDEDPGEVPHDEAVVCGDPADIGLGQGVGGVAPFTCGIIANPITFTFPDALGNDPRLIAEVIAQEAAHAWGLDHELLCEDPMTYLSGCGPKTFQDIDAECGEFEPRPCSCPIELQNSYQHILAAFGPSIPDVDGPVVLVTAPLTGTMYDEGNGFNVIVTITDDSLVSKADLYLNGQLHNTDTLEPWGWQIDGLQSGIYAIEVVATDEYENEGLSTPISILVGAAEVEDSESPDPDDSGGSQSAGSSGSGGDTEGDTAGQDEDGGGCGCSQGPTGSPLLATAPLFLLFLARRRRPTAH